MRNKGGFLGLAVMFFVLLISGCGGGGDGDSSPAGPSAPNGVTATPGDGEATIRWDNVTGATSYNIYYDNTTGVTKATGTKVDNVTSPNIVAGLTNGKPYFFVVTAVNAIGESAESIQVSATPTPAPPPPAPTGISATPGVGQATIRWDNVTGATSYNIYYDNTTGVTKATGTKVAGVTSPNAVTGLTNGTPYFFVVTAVNANGESVESSQVTATPTPAPAPPPAPANPTAVAGAGGATIGWDNVTGATSYNIYFDNTTGVTKATGTKITGVTSPNAVTGLIRGTLYYFVVTAVNANGESVESSQVSATPNPPNPTYSQSDLTGIWNIRVILSGTSPGWYGVTATVDASGNVTTSAPVGTATPPALPALSITTGIGAGVVSETGAGSNDTFSGKMSTSKNLIVGTSTLPDGTTFALHVFVKRVPGVTFDLANNTIAYHRIYTGSSNAWERGGGSIISGQLTLNSVVSGSITPPPTPLTSGISVNSTTGIVSIAAEPSFSGVMTADKKIIVGASTEAADIFSLRIIQMRGQTYTPADLTGVHKAFALHTDSPPSWARATWTTTTDPSNNVTVTDLLNSDGSTSAPIIYTQTIDALGNVSGGGMLSFGKDLYVGNGDIPIGSFMDIKVQ